MRANEPFLSKPLEPASVDVLRHASMHTDTLVLYPSGSKMFAFSDYVHCHEGADILCFCACIFPLALNDLWLKWRGKRLWHDSFYSLFWTNTAFYFTNEKNNVGKMDSFGFIEAIRVNYKKKKIFWYYCNKNKIKMLERKRNDLILFSWIGCFSFLDIFLPRISHPEVNLYKLFIC